MNFNEFQRISMDFNEFQPPHGPSLRELGPALLPTFGSPAALVQGRDPTSWLRSELASAGQRRQRRQNSLLRWIDGFLSL